MPLEHAAADGNADLFNALIGAGADGRAGWRGCQGRTLFDAAARGGSAEVISGLVAGGALANVNVVSARAPKRSALYRLDYGNRPDCCVMKRQRGAWFWQEPMSTFGPLTTVVFSSRQLCVGVESW